MKIGIISDTHDNTRSLIEAIEYFNDNNIELVLHCGDWVSPFLLHIFKEKLECPLKGVTGNADPSFLKFKYYYEKLELSEKQIQLSELFLDMEIDGKRIAVNHGQDRQLNKTIIESQLFDVYCIGHTHIQGIKKEGKTLVINPGSLIGYFAEKGNMPRGFAVYDTEKGEAELLDLDKLS